MKFYDRKTEIDSIIGKWATIGITSLLMKATEHETSIYLFESKKNEVLLVNELVEEIQLKLKIELFGTFKTFREIFGYLMELSKNRHFTLIIDEIQEFVYTSEDLLAFWEKSNLNEIDIVAVNDFEKRLIVVEVKRQTDKINKKELEQKANKLINALNDYQVEYRGVSMLDM